MSKPESTDAVVVGAGVMGCAVALRLAQRGLSVTVIERGIPGAEASSAAAGILGPQWEADEPSPLFDLGLQSRALYPAFAAELRALSGLDVGHATSGVLEVALAETDEAVLDARAAWQKARGLRVERLSGTEARKLEPHIGSQVRSALRMPDDGHVHARVLARALSQAAAVAGARFISGRLVRRVTRAQGRVTGVELDGETIAGGNVVVAAGSWSSLVEGGGVPPPVVRPARGQMVAIETRPPLFRHVIAPCNQGYLVPRVDGVALVGSTLEMVGFNKEVTVAGLSKILSMARAVVPSLDPCPVVETWSNFRPYTEDRLPVLGATDVSGLFLATGHHRYGILLAPITAQIIADLVVTGASSIDCRPFSVSRFAQR